jgi:energy-coupling factor transport system permease protein
VWICLAIVVQTLQSVPLTVFSAISLLVAFGMHTQRLFTLLRRTRWILFSLLLIYAFSTPGAALWSWEYAPTREGLADGLTQLARLVCVLAGLSILLTLLSRERLVGGLYSLFYPVRCIGLSRERIAVRLALTLHYAESSMRDTASDWRGAIEGALTSGAGDRENIELQVQTIRAIDIYLLILSAALLIWVWL